jgi:hypothetical protein
VEDREQKGQYTIKLIKNRFTSLTSLRLLNLTIARLPKTGYSLHTKQSKESSALCLRFSRMTAVKFTTTG